jgi:lipocalin
VLDLNDAHTRAIVGSPNRKFLWLLSEDPASTPVDFSEGLKRMEVSGFVVEKLISNPKRLK